MQEHPLMRKYINDSKSFLRRQLTFFEHICAKCATKDCHRCPFKDLIVNTQRLLNTLKNI